MYDESEKDKGYNTEEPPRSLIIESNSHRVCSIVYTKSEYESSRNPEMSPIHFTLLCGGESGRLCGSTCMKAYYIIPVLCMGVLGLTDAAERESFDFDWKFRYMGSDVPEEVDSPATASACEPGHVAAHAVDRNPATRWCAPDGRTGYFLQVHPGTRRKVESVIILWEKPNAFHIDVEIISDNLKKTRTLAMNQQDVLRIPVGNRPIDSFKVTILNGTNASAWASVREIVFLDDAGKPIRLRKPRRKVHNVVKPDFDDSGFKAVQLPHDWAIESPFLREKPNETGKLPWDGWGCYRKRFQVPSEFDKETQRYYLDFDGVMSNPRVYVNGRLAGQWAYGYNSFRVNLTPHLKPGEENLVAVLASNLPQSTRWYPGAGIYRHVWLEKTGAVHLSQWPVYVTTSRISADSAELEIRTRVENHSAQACPVTLLQTVAETSAAPFTVEVPAGGSRVVTQKLLLKKPLMWSGENPNLYTLQTRVLTGEMVLDSHETTFGVRTIEWRPEGFFLNGKRVQIKGVCEHHDLGALGAAFHARAYERKIEILKEMGCNSIRMSHNPPAPEVLDLCDKHGMLVIDELFDIWEEQKYDKANGYHLYWPKWWKRDVRNFMLRDRNHPCIIAWSGGNEVPELGTARGQEISNALRKEMRRFDKTRPYTVGSNDPGSVTNGFAGTVDVFGFNYKPDMYGRFRLIHPELPVYASETNSCVASRDTYFFPLSWEVGGGARSFHVSSYGLSAPGWGTSPDIEMYALDQNRHVAGEYVWTGFDYLGEPTPYNQDASNIGNFHGASEAEKQAAMEELRRMGNKAPSRSSYFGIVDLAGFPKDTYYLYRSHWAPEKQTCHILPHWNWPGREGLVTPVMVYSSGDEAELFVNGKSQGVRRRGQGDTYTQKLSVCKNAYRFVWENVVYEPGTVRVEVRRNGKPWAEAQRVTTGASSAVSAEVDRASIAGDGRDLAYISLSLVDAQGNVVPTDCRRVSFDISGAGELVGFCNGNQTDHTCMQSKQQSFFNGRMIAIVRGVRGASGQATVSVQAEGLPPVDVQLRVGAVE